MKTAIILLSLAAALAANEVKYPKKGDACLADSDCFEPWEVCTSSVCVHKDFSPLESIEWFGLIWTAIWLLVCNIGGVGGAGTLIPFLRLIFNFNVVDAIALSNITIFVSGFIRWVWDAKKRHPQKKNAEGKPFATLVDYSVAVMILPLGVTGAALGSTVSLLLPEPIIVAIMTVTLCGIAINIGFKLKSMYKAENEMKKTKEVEMTKVEKAQESTVAMYADSIAKSAESADLATFRHQESKHLNMKNLFSLLVIITLFLISLFRGNGKDKSIVGITKCMPHDHVLFAMLILSGIVYAVLAIWWMRKEHAYKEQIQYPFAKDELRMDTQTLVKLNIMGFCAGFLHSGFGVGSGFTINPTLVLLGMHPAPASATGMYIAMLNALAASIVVTLFGKMNLIYAVMLCIFTAIGTFPGLFLQHWLVQKTGRASITVAIIFTLVVFSAICNPIIASVNLNHRSDDGISIMETGSYC